MWTWAALDKGKTPLQHRFFYRLFQHGLSGLGPCPRLRGGVHVQTDVPTLQLLKDLTMNIKTIAALATALIASTAIAGTEADKKCGAGTCGKKTSSAKGASEASCSKKDASCGKKDGKEAGCGKKDASCAKKDMPATKK
jgi:hypothetical protein